MKKLFIIFILLTSIFIVAEAQMNKVSPFVRMAMMNNHTSMRKVNGKIDNTMISVLVESDDEKLIKDNGGRILAKWNNIYAVEIPICKLSALSANEHITRIEAGESCSVNLDTLRMNVNADAMANCYRSDHNIKGYTGRGVVVGLQDIGFDFTHPTFRTSDGKHLRIKAVWDQLSRDTVNSKFIVGRDYTTEEEILSLGHSYDGISQTHGTHTAGIAAGNGHEDYASVSGNDIVSPYIGLAPDADIVLSANASTENVDSIPKIELYKYTTTVDLLGFQYIIDYADSVGKPCVINFSEGCHDDLYESRLYGEVINNMVGPGHILCVSAGNESAGDGTYMHKKEGENKKSAFIAKWASNVANYVMRSTKPVKMCLSFYNDKELAKDYEYDATELSQYPDSIMKDTVVINNDTLVINIQTYPSCFDSLMYATDFFIKDKSSKRCGYSVPISLSVLGEDNDIEVFSAGGYFIKSNIDPSLTDYECTHNILFPGSVEDVICVGATSYVTKRENYLGNIVGKNYGSNGERAYYSSIGPALSGLTKPDVMAPGTNVVSSFNSYYSEIKSPEDVICKSEYNGRTYPWGIITGTSMSCPAVVGIIACWLELCPTLSPDQIKDVFAHTCTHYDESLSYPNNYYGYGQIDAMAGIEYIEKNYTGIEEVRNSKTTNDFQFSAFDINGIRHSSIDGKKGIFIVRKDNRVIKVMK